MESELVQKDWYLHNYDFSDLWFMFVYFSWKGDSFSKRDHKKTLNVMT